jgi:hypothetical protein
MRSRVLLGGRWSRDFFKGMKGFAEGRDTAYHEPNIEVEGEKTQGWKYYSSTKHDNCRYSTGQSLE